MILITNVQSNVGGMLLEFKSVFSKHEVKQKRNKFKNSP